MPKLTVTISKEADDKLRRANRHKGDLSKIIETLIIKHLKEPT